MDTPYFDPVDFDPGATFDHGAYFDHNATTPLDPRVRDAMLPWLDAAPAASGPAASSPAGHGHGNPSSAHAFGRRARGAVERAREQVASLLGAAPAEIVFTASGTEGNNAVLMDRGEPEAGESAAHIVYAAFEHPSIGAAIERLARHGGESTRVAPQLDGVVSAAAIEAALRDNTRLVCLMQANNELGTLQPVAEVARLCHRRGIPLLCDAVQAVGKVPVRVSELEADYLTLGGHKFHGPLGAAALWVSPERTLRGLLVGAAQEGGRRAGTENVPAIVGLGAAAELAELELEARGKHLGDLRDHFEAGLAAIAEARIHCADSLRLPHTSHVAFPGLVGQDLMMALDAEGLAVSTGAACGSGSPRPSSTLLAMGMEESEALASLRVSFGMTNTRAEVDRLLAALARLVPRLRCLPATT